MGSGKWLQGLTDELWKMEKRVEFDMDYLDSGTFLGYQDNIHDFIR